MEHEDTTRAGYDQVADEYAATYCSELDAKPVDQAPLRVVAEQAHQGPIADVGCGPGHVTRHLRELGRDVLGIDLSPRMILVAREWTPEASFQVGSMLALDAPDGGWGGSWRSTPSSISTLVSSPAPAPSSTECSRPAACSSSRSTARRRPRSRCGATRSTSTSTWDDRVSLDFRFFRPDLVARLLEDAGLVVEAVMERRPFPAEVQTRRCYVLAAKR